MQMTLTPVAGHNVHGSGLFALGAGSGAARLAGTGTQCWVAAPAHARAGMTVGARRRPRVHRPRPPDRLPALFGLGNRLGLLGFGLARTLAAAPAAALGLGLACLGLGRLGFGCLGCVPRFLRAVAGLAVRVGTANGDLAARLVSDLYPLAKQLRRLGPHYVVDHGTELTRARQ